MTTRSQRLPDFDYVKRQFHTEVGLAQAERGTVNIAVFGNTGVGKSTLLNAVFGRQMAATGTGDAVTEHIQYHGGPPEPLGIYDTPGFEIGGSVRKLESEITQMLKRNERKPLTDQVHVAWFVENAHSSRFVDSQAQLVSHLASFHIPVMLILTQVRRSATGGYPTQVTRLADSIIERGLPLSPPGTVHLVNAMHDPEMDDPVHGLRRLLAATFDAVPPQVHEALVAAQRVDLEYKRQAAAQIINRFTFTSGAAGATPLPVADLVLVTSSLARMFARISAVYGIPFQRKQLAQLATAVLLTGGATHATSRAIVKASGKQVAKFASAQAGKQGAKLVPLANLIVSAASGTSSALLAKAAGHAWARVCEHMLMRPDEPQEVTHAAELFSRKFDERAQLH